ncbi:uncharacterized protein EI97DRAFT_454031 [Westerdykella ornata]|uniref:Uncharacterized protein n=1 Tax=Westerdykella ornata TaxID=318751 RepID=A0A6A6JYF8_WESOR|nr:uncharacterized protein EI97DRAFT_454031 [Westerdykella ornata]KAF2280786.1 hypothetical protein EI97DRAFT_454031 [Westerdykella ornata]
MTSPSGNQPPRRPGYPSDKLLREAEQIWSFNPRAQTFEPTTPTTPTILGGTGAAPVPHEGQAASRLPQGLAEPGPPQGLAAPVPPRGPAPAAAPQGEGFGQLPDGGDISDPYAWPSARELARKLLDPPRQSYPVHHKRQGFVVIQLRWVLRVVGEPHFRNDSNLSRSVLKENSKLRTHGLAAGIPEGYWRWLCGNREGRPTGPDRSEYWIPENEFFLRPDRIPPPPPLPSASVPHEMRQPSPFCEGPPPPLPPTQAYYGMPQGHQQSSPPPQGPFGYPPPHYYYRG